MLYTQPSKTGYALSHAFICVPGTEWSAEQWKHRFGSNRPGATLNRTEHNHRLQPWQRMSPWLGWASPEESFLRFMCAVRLVENNNNLAPSDTLQTQPDVTSLKRRAEVCSCGGDRFVQRLSLSQCLGETQCIPSWGKHCTGVCVCDGCVCVCMDCHVYIFPLLLWHCWLKPSRESTPSAA